MKIKSIHIKNLKGFVDSGKIDLSPTINILIGPNNSGKSILIKSCYLLQPANNISESENYIRKNQRKGTVNAASVKIEFDQFTQKYIKVHPQVYHDPSNWQKAVLIGLEENGSFNSKIYHINNNDFLNLPSITSSEPNNFIYPYFSKRKVVQFNETFNVGHAIKIQENLRELYAKIDRISNSDYPANLEYRKVCKKILGFNVSCSLSDNGKQAGLIVSSAEYIPLDEMGDGTTNLLGLIVDLCIAKDKLFLIEEIENDIHPKALKDLLNLIGDKSENNQFIISTHSNIVTKYLGTKENSKIFQIEMKIRDKMPHSSAKEVKNTPSDRIKVLEDLGYELYDFELWSAYLILEESTAERIIRDYLIPTFVPSLHNKLKTIAAQGVDDLSPRFHDFLRLFIFIHLSDAYKNKAWVYADGDRTGLNSIKNLRKRFKTWNDSHFQNFSQENFEYYYPERFKKKAKKTLAIADKKRKFKSKGKLVNEVIEWTLAEKQLAKKEFRNSAQEIITILKNLDKKINK